MVCPKCGSALLSKNEDGDLECVCGKIIYADISKALTEKVHITVGSHYPKTIEKIPIIKQAIDGGQSIRRISRDTKIAINTIRKVLRTNPFSLYAEVDKETQKVSNEWIHNKDYEPIEGLIEYFPDEFIPILRKWATQCSTESRGKANLDGQAHALTLVANFLEIIYREARDSQDISDNQSMGQSKINKKEKS